MCGGGYLTLGRGVERVEQMNWRSSPSIRHMLSRRLRNLGGAGERMGVTMLPSMVQAVVINLRNLDGSHVVWTVSVYL